MRDIGPALSTSPSSNSALASASRTRVFVGSSSSAFCSELIASSGCIASMNARNCSSYCSTVNFADIFRR